MELFIIKQIISKVLQRSSKERFEVRYYKCQKNSNYKKADKFRKLLESIKFQWVKINRGGPEKLEGVLSDANKHFASLIVKEEVVRFSMNHIRNISYGLKIEKQDEKSEDQDDLREISLNPKGKVFAKGRS